MVDLIEQIEIVIGEVLCIMLFENKDFPFKLLSTKNVLTEDLHIKLHLRKKEIVTLWLLKPI